MAPKNAIHSAYRVNHWKGNQWQMVIGHAFEARPVSKTNRRVNALLILLESRLKNKKWYSNGVFEDTASKVP